MKRDRRKRCVRELTFIGRLRLAAGGGMLAVHLAAGTAWAQKPGRLPNEDAGWLQYIIAAGLAVVILTSAFINPKRSHLT